jgi:hypothetical protein
MTEDGRARLVQHQPHWHDGDCYYTEATKDPKCEGCRWREGVEATPFELRGFTPDTQFLAPGKAGAWRLAFDDGTKAPLFKSPDGVRQAYLRLESLEPIK